MRLSRSAAKPRFLLGLLLLALAFSFAASPASADSVTITGVGGANQGGVYVAPYYLTVGETTGIVAMCDDFSHEVHIGDNWIATNSTFANLSSTRWGTSFTHEYEEAAWLFDQFLAAPSQAGDINFAVWALFTPSAKLSSGYTAGAANWLALANAQSFSGYDFSGFRVLTPTNPTTPQEYLIKVPEPGSFMLVAIGLMALALLRKESWRAATRRERT